MLKLPQTTFSLVLGVLMINLIGWQTFNWLSAKSAKTQEEVLQKAAPTNHLTDSSTATNSTSTQENNQTTITDQDLVARDPMQQADLKSQLDDASRQIATLAAQPTASKAAVLGVKEHVLYLGQGESSGQDWSRLAKTKTTLDPTNYPASSQVIFQTSLQAVDGRAQARLVNTVTDQVISTTQLQNNDPKSKWQSSSSFSLPAKRQEYVVEISAPGDEKVQLNGARLVLKSP